MATQDRKDTTPNAFEDQAIALAEQLGRIAGTIEGTAGQWVNRQALSEQLTRVRDSASQLIDSLAEGAAKGRDAASSAMSSLGTPGSKPRRGAAKPSTNKTRMDLAHAPGKKHRKPAPRVRGVKKSDQRIPKMKTAAAARQRRKSYA